MSERINIAVCGAMGRMGQRVIGAILAKPELRLTGAVEWSGHQKLGQDVGLLQGHGPLEVMLTDSLAKVGESKIYIDFTSIEAGLANLEIAARLGLAALIGTTGFSENDQKKLQTAGQKIPVLWAPNMSTGVNVMYKIAAQMAKVLGDDFDIEIVEAHHNLKKDAPSGTAMKLYQTLAAARGQEPGESLVPGRSGLVGARTKSEIGVLAVRGGDIVGDHTVYFCGPGERLELTHRAQTRDTFAQGAVRAALWLSKQKPGLYTIDDTLV